MADELPDYLIGDKGVQLVGTPLHTPDSGLLRAENVEFTRESGIGGIGSRRALYPLNGTALGGRVLHLGHLPFPFPTAPVMMVALNAGETNAWLSTLDGTTFTELPTTTLKRAPNPFEYVANISANLNPGNIFIQQRAASFRRRFYHASDDYTIWYSGIIATPSRPPLAHYDGDIGLELFRMPDNPTSPAGSYTTGIVGLWVFNGFIYIAVFDPGGVAPNLKGRVLRFDPEDGTLVRMGNRFGQDTGENTKGIPWALTRFAGKLFVGTMGISGNPAGGVYTLIENVDDVWTLDHAFAADEGYVMDMLVYKGALYLATSCDATGNAKIYKRTPTGTYSTSFTGPDVALAYNGGLIEFDGNLYCCYFCDGANNLLIKKFDGASWTTDLDVTTTYTLATPFAPGQPLVFGGALYWPFYDATLATAKTAFLLKRTAAGVWSRPLTNRGLIGCLGFYRSDTDPVPVPPLGGGFSSGFSGGFE